MNATTKLVEVTTPGGKTHWEIHRAGCKHLSQAKYRHREQNPTYGSTASEHIAGEVAIYEDQDQGWTAEDFRIMPCVPAEAK